MKRLIALAVTLLILGAILVKVDRVALLENIKATQPLPFAIALFLFFPQNLIIIYRWKSIASRFTPMGWGEASGLILAGAAMNVVLPSKMGDLTKAYFLIRSGAMDFARAVNLVVFEKLLDLGSLCLLATLGVAAAYGSGLSGIEISTTFHLLSGATLAISLMVIGLVVLLYFTPPHRRKKVSAWFQFLEAEPRTAVLRNLFTQSGEVTAMLQAKGSDRIELCALSLLLWVLHLVQIYFFFVCLNAPVPWLPFAILMPLAIFVGLLPLSLFGMGTRDAAIIFFFSAYYPPAILAGVGLYVSLRYLIPALTGLPFLNHYLNLTRNPKPLNR